MKKATHSKLLFSFGCISISVESTATSMTSIQPSVLAISKNDTKAMYTLSKRCGIECRHTAPQHSHISFEVGMFASLHSREPPPFAGHASQHGNEGKLDEQVDVHESEPLKMLFGPNQFTFVLSAFTAAQSVGSCKNIS